MVYNTLIDEHCSTIRRTGSDIDAEQLKTSLDVFVSILKETNDYKLKCTFIGKMTSPLINLSYKNKIFAESDLITHEFLIILRDEIIIDQFHRRNDDDHITQKLLQQVTLFFTNLSHNINDSNILGFKHLLFDKILIDELATCLNEMGTYGKYLDDFVLLRSIKYLLLTYKNYLRHPLMDNEYSQIKSIFSGVIQCLCSSFIVDMITSLKYNFSQTLDDSQVLFLDTMPFYLQWYCDYGNPDNFLRILRMFLNKFTTWMINCPPDSYSQCSGQIGRMIRHLNYFLVRPIESENVYIFSEEFYNDYCRLVSHWSLILSSILTYSSDSINVKSNIRTIIKNLYNFTLHLNVLNHMKTIPNLIPMLLQVTDIDDDEIQINAYRCLGKIMMEADIKMMTNPSKIAAVYIEFISNTIDDPYQKERFHSLLESLKNFVQHDQVKSELIEHNALPLLVKCTVENQFDPIKVQQIALEILLALSFNNDACSFFRQNQDFMNHIRTLVENHIADQSGLQRAAEGLLWKLEEEEKAVAKPSILNLYKYDIMISYSHKDQRICHQIHEQLVKDGYQVWFDKDCLRGSTMVGIANAIENSKYVLICMSNTYKQSVYCHSEAHYAFERGCRLIPIIIEPNYKPDGWLGIIVSGKIYVEFGNVEFKLAYEKLKNEISEQEYENSNQSLLPSSGEKDQMNTVFLHPEPLAIVSEANIDLPNCIREWTHDHVRSFLIRNGLGNTLLPLLTCMDGHRLLQLYEICLLNRESMYQSLKFELNEKHRVLLPIADYLNFLHEIKFYIPSNSSNVKTTQYSLLSLTFCNVL
ncbi:unnamed protein product [Adineta steineri]|uniref:TIR domain-containing protein n=1 Tax=Adineta steineri TaxID=433720 RepID=A0A818FMF0_9BILA|nr:unnamed protein product [Adineta steineri]CAF3476178.1 unnamed protein product [Adineta steineri]